MYTYIYIYTDRCTHAHTCTDLRPKVPIGSLWVLSNVCKTTALGGCAASAA